MAAWGGRRAGGGGGPGGRRRGPGGRGVPGKESPGKGRGYKEGELGREKSRKVGEGHQRRGAGKSPWSPGGESLPAIELVSFM